MSALTKISNALASRLGEDRAEEVLARFGRYSNQPNAVRGAAKLPSDPALERAALEVFEDPALEAMSALDLFVVWDDSLPMWALLTLAARADATILDRLPADIAEQGAPKIASIRRAATRHLRALQAAAHAPSTDGAAASGSPPLPAKVSEVAKWLAAHPEADPRLFAPRAGQRAAARRAALRALGEIATSEALDVLGEHASDHYSDADLAELHRAWGRFDRRAFAAAMFVPGPNGVRLDVCSNLEGIGAVQGLSGLDVILDKRADLAPLAACVELRSLRVHATGGSGLTSIEPLVRLPHLAHLELIGTTRDADLTMLRETPIEQLYLHLDGADGSFLTEMPRLRGLRLSGGAEAHEFVEPNERDPEPRAAHPGLADTVLQLVRTGVSVLLYRHERSWVPGLVERAPADIEVVEARGMVRLSRALTESGDPEPDPDPDPADPDPTQGERRGAGR